MAQEFKYLFTPIRIRNKTAKNRIVSTAHGANFSPLMEENRFVEYNRAKAAGGCGLSIISSLPVSVPHGRKGLQLDTETLVNYMMPGLRRVAEAYHDHGCLTTLQLASQGSESISWAVRANEIGFTPAGFSPTVGMSRMSPAHEMDAEEIEQYVEGFVIGALGAKEAGFDGVQIQGSGGFLGQQSMTPWDNQRTDKWGQDKLAFVLEIVERVRKAVGDDFIIDLRMPWDDFVPVEQGGVGPEGYKNYARRLDGKVDIITMREGRWQPHFGHAVPNMWYPLGVWVPGQAGIRSVVEKSLVIGHARIKDPVQADKILAEGLVDLVAMTRGIIADPELPNKAQRGKLDEIRTCVSCNQGCADRSAQLVDIRCLQNPNIGQEFLYGLQVQRADTRKKVVVVGGGPAGLEAARVCAERGHEVVLFEKQSELGGQINILTKVRAREEFVEVVRWRSNEFRRLGIEARLGTEADGEKVLAEKPDVVIVATGSVPVPPQVGGTDQENVLSVWDVLLGTKPVGQRVLVYDADGRHKGVSVAEFLADQGKVVEIATPFTTVGQYLGLTHFLGLHSRLHERKVTYTTMRNLVSVEGKTVTLVNPFNYAEEMREVDTVVYATANKACDELYKALRGKVKEVYVIGDAWCPRTAHEATTQAFDIAQAL